MSTYVTITGFSIWVPFLVGLFLIGRAPNQIKVFIQYLGIASLIEVAMYYMRMNNINNLWLSHVYAALTPVFMFFVLMPRRSTGRDKQLSKIGLVIVLVLIPIEIYLKGSNAFNVISSTLSALFIGVLARYRLKAILHESGVKNLWSLPIFWITGSIAAYQFSSALINIVRDYLLKNDPAQLITLFYVFFIIHIGFYIIPSTIGLSKLK